MFDYVSGSTLTVIYWMVAFLTIHGFFLKRNHEIKPDYFTAGAGFFSAVVFFWLGLCFTYYTNYYPAYSVSDIAVTVAAPLYIFSGLVCWQGAMIALLAKKFEPAPFEKWGAFFVKAYRLVVEFYHLLPDYALPFGLGKQLVAFRQWLSIRAQLLGEWVKKWFESRISA